MREYYHFYPVCPRCHEPTAVDSPPLIRAGENIIKCSSCNTYFPERINLYRPDKFPKTLKLVCAGCRQKQYLEKLPLLWKVELNFIEREYLKWIAKTKGKFLITWPWREVKFIPLLISEYLLDNPHNRMVVVCRSDCPTNEKIIGYPKLWEAFRHLIYLEGDLQAVDGDLRREINRADWRFYFPKVWVTYYTVRNIRTGREIFTGICDKNIESCRKEIFSEISKNFGKNCVRRLLHSRDVEGRGKELIREDLRNTDEGFLDIELIERFQRTCKKQPLYRWRWLWRVLLNSEKIRRPSKIIPWTVIHTPEAVKREVADERLIFIEPSDLDIGNMFRFIKEIEPDLVIFENADEFIADLIYRGEKSRHFLKFLKEMRIPTVVMFSLDRELRHLYRIHLGNSFLKNLGVIPHTLDCGYVLEKLKPNLERVGSVYPNPLSSKPDELSEPLSVPEIEYRHVQDLDAVDSIIQKLSETEESISEEIIKYLKELRRSPIPVRETGQRKNIFFRRNLRVSFYYILEKLRELKINVDTLQKLYLQNCNPLLYWLKENLHELLQDRKTSVTVIVHHDDAKNLRKILIQEGFNECLEGRLAVCGWDGISEREIEIDEQHHHFIISFLPPSKYPLNRIRAKKIIFSGSWFEISRIKKIVSYRISETASRPICRLEDDDAAPGFLKDILVSPDIPENDAIRELYLEAVVAKDRSGRHTARTGDILVEQHIRLKAGQRAVLLVVEDGRGVFIPLGASLLVWDGRTLKEVPGRSADKKLIGREIVEKRGLYLTAKHVFVEFMAVHGGRIFFEKPPFRWEGFRNLYADSIRWISRIRKAIEYFSKQMGVSQEHAEFEIAKYLSTLNMTAKDPEYIKNWWTQYDILHTPLGSFQIYHVEHPKSLQDMEKLYQGLARLFPEIRYDADEAKRTYTASRLIQDLRLAMLKGDMKRWHFSLYPIFERFKRNLRYILEISSRKRIKNVYFVKLRKEVKSFRFIDNYFDYLEERILR